MSKKIGPQEKYELEEMIDGTSVGQLLEAIADICHEKAEHVATNWQDYDLEKLWTRCGTKISALASKLPDLP